MFQIDLVGTDAKTADREQLFRRTKNLFRQLGPRADTDDMNVLNPRLQLVRLKGPGDGLDVGLPVALEQIDRRLVDILQQQNLDLAFGE
jgi:hypothetical protein